ncbi:MAG: hypothetical protein WC829_22675 [Hyphomicrobium sp.]|jgi:hypothetical protein
MISKQSVPFGGVFGWLADLTVSRKMGNAKSGPVKSILVTESYYAAEPNERKALMAIRAHAEAGKDATLTPRRSLSRNEVTRLGLKPGQVKSA